MLRILKTQRENVTRNFEVAMRSFENRLNLAIKLTITAWSQPHLSSIDVHFL